MFVAPGGAKGDAGDDDKRLLPAKSLCNSRTCKRVPSCRRCRARLVYNRVHAPKRRQGAVPSVRARTGGSGHSRERRNTVKPENVLAHTPFSSSVSATSRRHRDRVGAGQMGCCGALRCRESAAPLRKWTTITEGACGTTCSEASYTIVAVRSRSVR